MQEKLAPSLSSARPRSPAAPDKRQCFALLMVLGAFGSAFSGAVSGSVSGGNRLLLWAVLSLLNAGQAVFFLRLSRKMGVSAAEYPAGKAVRIPLLVILAVLCAFQAARLANDQAGMIKTFLLENTARPIILLALLLAALLLLPGGIMQLARSAQVLLGLGLVPALLLLSFSLGQMDWGELRTLFRPELRSFGPDLLSALPDLMCFLPLLFFWQEADPAADTVLPGALSALSGITLGLLFACTGIFTLAGMDKLTYPVEEIARALRLSSYSLLERLDLFFVAARTVTVCLALSVYLFAVSRALAGLFPFKSMLTPLILAFLWVGAFCVFVNIFLPFALTFLVLGVLGLSAFSVFVWRKA